MLDKKKIANIYIAPVPFLGALHILNILSSQSNEVRTIIFILLIGREIHNIASVTWLIDGIAKIRSLTNYTRFCAQVLYQSLT